MTKHLTKHRNIINKLKQHISSRGYYEDLGQKELREYREFVFRTLPYAEAASAYQSLSNEIDSL